MRTLIKLFSAVFITATAQTWALESDIFRIDQFAISHVSPVSFSIGYPKSWRVTQGFSSPQGESMAADWGPICTFGPTNFSHWPSNYVNFVIWHSTGATVKEAADSFSASVSKRGLYTIKSSNSVITSAGDSGCLVEGEGSFELRQPVIVTNLCDVDSLFKSGPITGHIRVVSHDYFFHCGAKGSIRIMIVTPAADSALRSELDQLVVQTLRFNGD